MNQKIRKMAVTLLLSLTVFTSVPQKANALIIFMDANIDVSGNPHFDTLCCFLVLPFCLLDQKVEGLPSLSRQDLLDQGVREKEADLYISQTQELKTTLLNKKLKFTVDSKDTKQSLTRDLMAVMPAAQEEFVDFYTTQVLAK